MFNQRERASRRIDRSLQSLLAKLPDTCHPMDVVRTAISYLGAEDPEEDDSAESANFAKSLRHVRGDAHHRRHRHASPARPGADRAAQPPRLRGELPVHVLRRGPGPGDRQGVRTVDDPVRRAQLQRLHLRRPGDHLHAVRHLQRGDRRDRRAEGPAARRGQRGRHARHDRDRRPVEGGGVAARQAFSQRQGHGLRPPRLQERRLPGADHERGPEPASPRPATGSAGWTSTTCWKGRCSRPRASSPTWTSRPARPTT